MVLDPTRVHDRVQSSAACRYRSGAFDLEFQAMATKCRVSFTATPKAGQQFAGSVLAWVADFESRYSRFLPESLVSHINRAAGREWVPVDAETEQLLGLCHHLHFLTRGVFDPTTLPLIRLWDWKTARIPSESDVQQALAQVGWPKVQRAPGRVFLPVAGMALDLGGVGKEYAVDRVAQMARQQGIPGGVVDFGQDVFVFGDPPHGTPCWHVGLEDPEKPGTCWAGLGVRDAGVATSGDYVRHFMNGGRRFGHILDIRTGQPVANGCRAVSVVAPTCTLAGALATSAFVLGPEEGLRLIDSTFQAEGCITTDNCRSTTRRFHDYVVS